MKKILALLLVFSLVFGMAACSSGPKPEDTVKKFFEAMKAFDDGADYIGCGAVFSTSTKSDAKALGVEGLKAIAKVSKLPVVAIGGIDENNISLLKNTGICGVAIVSAIFSKNNILLQTKRIKETELGVLSSTLQ